MKTHTVKSGECLATIAKRYGFLSWKRIYDAPENNKFRENRPNPNVIHPGDEIFIPDLELKYESATDSQRHRYKLKTQKFLVRMEIKDETFEGIEGVPFELYVDNELLLKGKTKTDGLIETEVNRAAKNGVLKILGGEIEIKFGELDPVTHVTGIQQRLNNMGFNAGKADGIVGPKTMRAIMDFQGIQKNLEVTGKIDDDLRAALLREHDGDEELRSAEESMEKSTTTSESESEGTALQGNFDEESDEPGWDAYNDQWDASCVPEPLNLSNKRQLVKGTQQRLNRHGFDAGPIDGVDGPKTQAGVRAFQTFCRENAGGDDPHLIDSGPIDGVVGPLTKAAMESYFGI